MNVDPRNRSTSAPRPDGRGSRRRRRAETPEESARKLAQLRAALVDVTPETVGGMLPEAAAHASGARHSELAIAFEPTVTTAVRSMARHSPELIGEILAPTIATAVRKAVKEAIASMLEHFNRTLERSLSLQSMKWRMEAARTGRPLAEVVFLRTLRYRVEQVFLIDTRSSLVLHHVVGAGLESQPPDQVAAMLAAIDTFGREALGPTPAEAHLDKFELGDLVVWVERAPSITLTAVLRGSAGVDFGRQLAEVRERIFLAHEQDYARFHGDPSPFERARPYLESLLCTERLPPRRHAVVWLSVAAVLVVMMTSFLAWRAHARGAARERDHAAILGALADEPGLVVTAADWTARREHIVGLRDPLAPEPAAVLARRGLPTVPTDFAAFVSLDPRLVEPRARRALAPPPGVTLAATGGTLHLSGSAPRAWIDEARLLARAVPGVERVDDRALRPAETLAALRDLDRALAEIEITFPTGRSSLERTEEAALRRAEALASQGIALAADARLGACVVVTGHADPPGTEAQNRSLREARARVVGARLEAGGIDAAHVRVRAAPSEGGADEARRVTLRLETSEPGEPPCGGEP